MDEEIAIIDSNTRNEKIKNFFIRNKKKLILLSVIIILSLLSFFTIDKYENKKKIEISNLYNSTIIQYSKKTQNNTLDILINLVDKKDPTYSPLSL